MKKPVKKLRKAELGDAGKKYKTAVSDSSAAAKFKNSPGYSSSSEGVKKFVEAKIKSPSAIRSGKDDAYVGNTPSRAISMKALTGRKLGGMMKKGGSVKSKKK